MITGELICRACGALLDPERTAGMCAACLIGGALDDTLKEEPLGEFGGHELVDIIARGGMGIVYRARQNEPRREVALKTLHGAELRLPEARARLRAEIRALVEIEHPAILPLYACGEQDGVPFFTMQLAGGGSLAEHLGDFAGKWRKIAEVMATVAEAVHHAHERGVLHRDLKPANLLFDERGRIYVSDFGLARFAGDAASDLTLPAAVLGTPHYLAPEVAARGARAATTASDVWSLGVILYEMLAQRHAFEGDSVAAVLRAIGEREAPNPSRFQPGIPRELVVIVSKAMASDPIARYGTARMFAEDLRRWLEGRPILARSVSRFERIRLWAGRNPAVAALSCALLIGLIGGGLALGAAWRSSREAARVLRENLYAADVSVAQHAARDGDIGRAATLLDTWLPKENGPDLREFAWHYLRGQVRGDPCEVLRGHTGLVSGLIIPQAGERAFTCSHDGHVRSWRLPSGESAGDWRCGSGLLMDIDALPDGRLLVTGEEGLHVLNPADGTFVRVRGGVSYNIRAAPDGRTALSGVHRFIFQNDDELDIVPIPGGDQSAAINGPIRRLSKSGGRAAFSADGRLLATGTWGGTIKLWSWPEGAIIGELRPSDTVVSLAFSPDGATLAAAERTGHVVVWDVAKKAVRARLLEHAPRVVWSVAFSRDGSRLVTAGSDQTVRLWETETFSLLHTYRGHSSEVWRAAFAPDGRRIVSVSKDETVRIWNADPARPVTLPTGIRERTPPMISDDSRSVALALRKGGIAVFETNSWREIARCGGAELPLGLLSGGSHLVAIDSNRTVRRWHLPNGTLETEIELESAGPVAQRHMLSPNGEWLAGYGVDNDIVIWSTRNGRLITRLKGHTNLVLCAAFSPNGDWFATGGRDLTARLWRVGSDGTFRAASTLAGHKLTVVDVAFSPDGSSVATASLDDTVRVWSVADGRVQQNFPGHLTGALAVVFLPGSPSIATLDGATSLKLWDLRSGRSMLDFPGAAREPTDTLVASPDGRMLLATGEDGGLRLWEASK